ncbi:MAG: hypothetical protein JWO82_2785, partial [Akkermansiaceae bacterium]|nr:hypothetical protein [Akkermansiaceae bacterium]
PGIPAAMVEKAMPILSYDDPALAAETVVKLDLPQEVQAGLEGRILKDWSAKDALAALPWFFEHRAKLKQEEALQNVVALWLKQSPWSLQSYVEQAKPGKDTDDLILAVMAKVSQQGLADENGDSSRTSLAGLKRGAAKAMIARLSEPALREQAEKNLPPSMAR